NRGERAALGLQARSHNYANSPTQGKKVEYYMHDLFKEAAEAELSVRAANSRPIFLYNSAKTLHRNVAAIAAFVDAYQASVPLEWTSKRRGVNLRKKGLIRPRGNLQSEARTQIGTIKVAPLPISSAMLGQNPHFSPQ